MPETHPEQRLRERTHLDPTTIRHLEAEAKRLSSKVPPGKYYLPLKDPAGLRTGYASFKTVGSYPNHKLVLTTILHPDMKPKGMSLGHISDYTTKAKDDAYDAGVKAAAAAYLG